MRKEKPGRTWNRTGKVVEMAPPNRGRRVLLSPAMLARSLDREAEQAASRTQAGEGGGEERAGRVGDSSGFYRRPVGREASELAARRSHADHRVCVDATPTGRLLCFPSSLQAGRRNSVVLKQAVSPEARIVRGGTEGPVAWPK